MSDGPRLPAAGRCWFCSSGLGSVRSLAFPFWSNTADAMRVVVVPRCEACARYHRRREIQSTTTIVLCAAVPLVVASALPLSGMVGTLVTAAALLGGFAAGIAIVVRRTRSHPSRHGRRLAIAALDHPEYLALSADTGGWRQQRGPATTKISRANLRRETVAHYRQVFSADATALAALEQGCRDAGVPPTS